MVPSVPEQAHMPAVRLDVINASGWGAILAMDLEGISTDGMGEQERLAVLLPSAVVQPMPLLGALASVWLLVAWAPAGCNQVGAPTGGTAPLSLNCHRLLQRLALEMFRFAALELSPFHFILLTRSVRAELPIDVEELVLVHAVAHGLGRLAIGTSDYRERCERSAQFDKLGDIRTKGGLQRVTGRWDAMWASE